jgi:hypothetical protein
VKKPKASMMEIHYVGAKAMAELAPNLPPGWWIVDMANQNLFDGPYETRAAAFERYQRLPLRMRNVTSVDIEEL